MTREGRRSGGDQRRDAELPLHRPKGIRFAEARLLRDDGRLPHGSPDGPARRYHRRCRRRAAQGPSAAATEPKIS
jgi:hypothetical protein